MTLENEFALPDGESENPAEGAKAATGAATTPAPPVIVIEYRDRGIAGRLMPPALILLAALAIASYQRKTPAWPMTPRPQSAASPMPRWAANDKPGTLLTEGPPIASPSPDLATPRASTDETIVKADTPGVAPGAPPSPFELDATDGLKPLAPPPPGPPPVTTAEPEPTPPPAPAEVVINAQPTPEVAAIVPGPANPTDAPSDPAEPSKEDILRDIEREAHEKSAQRQDLEGMKTNARSILLGEAVAKVHEGRSPFRDELRQLLAQKGDKVGQDIAALCDRYGKEPMPEVRRVYIGLMKTAPKRMTRQAKVQMMRAAGVPEPLILDQICRDFDTQMNSRGGPRSEDEVRIRAARALLAIPLPAAALAPASSSARNAAEPAEPGRADPARPVAGVETRP